MPEGVVLAAPDGIAQIDFSAPTHAKPETEHEPVDPAAAIPSEETPAPRSPQAELDAEFNMLFGANAPALMLMPATSEETPAFKSPLDLSATPGTSDPSPAPLAGIEAPLAPTSPLFSEPTPLPEANTAPSTAMSPFFSEPVPLTEATAPSALSPLFSEPTALPAANEAPSALSSLFSEPAPAQEPVSASEPTTQQDSLAELLDQLSKSNQATPKPMESSSLSQEPPAPPPAEPTEPSSITDNWNLDPTEAPPLSGDWSLVAPGHSSPAPPEEPYAYSPADLQPDAPGNESDNSKPESIQEAFAHRVSELKGSLNAALYSETGQQFDPEMPGTIQTSGFPRVQPSVSLDALVPPPTTNLPGTHDLLAAPSQSISTPDMMDSALGFGAIPTWDTQPEPQPETALTGDFGMLPASTDGWGTDFQPTSLDSAPEEVPQAEAQPASETPASVSLDALSDCSMSELESIFRQEEGLTEPMPEALEIDDSEESWSEDDYIPESAELNSSHTAYDLNHYDDPDEPSQALELDEATTDLASELDLQAMADMLSQLKPQSATKAEPAANPTTYADTEPQVNLNASLFDEDTETELDALPEQGEPDAPACHDIWEPQALQPSEAEPVQQEAQTADTEMLSDFEFEANHTNTGHTNTGEEDMLKLKGNKATPEQSLMKALSAKFIARPKAAADSPALSPELSDEPMSPKPAAAHQDEDIPLDPAGLLHELPVSKIKPPTLSQAMSSFEEEMLLQETRFIRQSINNLVDGYFARKEQDNSC